jgi:nucleotide-binding universal stress UspA family protein
MKTTTQSILVPIDFEPASRSAMEYASDLAERLGARILLLHVVEDRRSTSAGRIGEHCRRPRGETR